MVAIVGSLGWHDVPLDGGIIGRAVGEAAVILASDEPPQGRVGCEWCAFYQQLGVDVTQFSC